MVKLTFGAADDENSPLPPPEGGGTETDVVPGGTPAPETPRRRGRPPGSKNKTSTVNLEANLLDKIREELIAPVTMVSPLAAANMELRAERTAKAAARMAAKNPALRKGIEKMLEGSDVLTLVMFPLSTAVMIMVDWDRMPADTSIARAMGVNAAWDYAEYPRGEVIEPDANGYSPFVQQPEPSARNRGVLGRVTNE